MRDVFLIIGLLRDGDIRWTRFPQDLWVEIVRSLDALGIAAYGFGGVTDHGSIADFEYFRYLSPVPIGTARYIAYEGNRESVICIWKLDEASRDALQRIPFAAWAKSNPGYSADEIVFFNASGAKLIAVPYEDMIILRQLCDDELQAFCAIDRRIKSNLWDAEGRRVPRPG